MKIKTIICLHDNYRQMHLSYYINKSVHVCVTINNVSRTERVFLNTQRWRHATLIKGNAAPFDVADNFPAFSFTRGTVYFVKRGASEQRILHD